MIGHRRLPNPDNALKRLVWAQPRCFAVLPGKAALGRPTPSGASPQALAAPQQVGALNVRLALYQPDMPQNVGAAIRIAACFGKPLDVIEPCGFALTDKALQRAAMDYADRAVIERHASFSAFLATDSQVGRRLVLIETDGPVRLHDFVFEPADTLILGRESAGSPPELYAAAHAVVRIPLAAGARSLNVAVAGAVAMTEAMRQTGGFARC
jgi:tRNA (cytidine/uridine-2'-O-)-methyltransferase